MALTGTDLFQADFTQIAGIIRAGEATISFDDDLGNPQELAAMNVEFKYGQQLALEQLTGGKVLAVVQPSSGVINIQALLGSGLKTFLEGYSDICNFYGNELTLTLETDLTCDTPSILDALNAYGSSTIVCHSVLATQLGVGTNVKGYFIQSNVQLFVLNAGWVNA